MSVPYTKRRRAPANGHSLAPARDCSDQGGEVAQRLSLALAGDQREVVVAGPGHPQRALGPGRGVEELAAVGDRDDLVVHAVHDEHGTPNIAESCRRS